MKALLLARTVMFIITLMLVETAVDATSLSVGVATIKFGKLELQLESYEGAVRVVSSNLDDGKELQDQDVIVSIGGKKVGTPEEMFQVLRKHYAETSISVDVIRHFKHITLPLQINTYRALLPSAPPTPPTVAAANTAPPLPPTP